MLRDGAHSFHEGTEVGVGCVWSKVMAWGDSQEGQEAETGPLPAPSQVLVDDSTVAWEELEVPVQALKYGTVGSSWDTVGRLGWLAFSDVWRQR